MAAIEGRTSTGGVLGPGSRSWELPLIEEAGDGARLLSNQAWGLRAFLARNTMRLGRISKRMRTPMFLIDSHGKRPVCVACHRLGSYQEAEPDVFICDVCVKAADARLRRFAETVPELRDHRLKRWRQGCDCERSRRRGNRAV